MSKLNDILDSLPRAQVDFIKVTKEDLKKAIIEFTKAHVEQALRAVYNEGLDGVSSWSGNPYTGEGSDYLDLDKILKVYPESKIK